jgi:hypothetical protein
VSAAILPLAQAVPLTPGQERLFLAERRITAGAPRRLESVSVLVEGALALGAFKRAVGLVVDRHDALRATIRTRADGVPVQLVARRRVSVRVRDAPGASPTEAVGVYSRTPGDPDLFHVELTRIAPERAVISVFVHHALSDGWSIAVLFDELSAAYDAFVAGREPDLPPLEGGYARACVEMRRRRCEGIYEDELDYWETQLAGPWPRLGIGADPGVSAIVADHALLGEESPAVALAAIAVALHAESGTTDVRIGTLVPARTEAGLQHLIGFFANTVVLRLRLDPTASLGSLEAYAKTTLVDALARQSVPIQDVMRRLGRDAAFTPEALYEAMLAFEALRQHALSLVGTRCTELVGPLLSPRRAPTTVALRWRFERSGGAMLGALTYAAERVDGQTAGRLAARFHHAAALLRQSPAVSVADAALESG